MKDAELKEQFLNSCVDNRCVSPHKITQAKLLAQTIGKEIYDVLLELHLLTLEQVNATLCQISGFPAADPLSESLHTPPSKEILASISAKVAINNRLFPLRIEEDELHLVMANPTDDLTVEAISKMCGRRIARYVGYPKNIMRTVARYYSPYGRKSFEELVQDGLDEISGRRRIEPPPSIWTEPLSQALYHEISLSSKARPDEQPIEPGEVAVSLLVQKILDNAIYLGSSDVHFEPFHDVIKVRFRKDGTLFSQWFIPNPLMTHLFNRIKIMAGLNTSITRRTQSGYIHYDPARMIGVDIRASIVPTLFGERVALRLMDKSRTLLDPAKLGLHSDVLAAFESQINAPQGMILVTGPTGSGKTTTIYAALDRLNREERCIITIEDPIEYLMSGVSQVQVDPRNDMGFASAFREVLRQDPDVILLGEIRDNESAEVAVAASSTGHLVFTTLHTNDSASAIQRLISLGADPFVLSDSLQLIVAQRLLRRLCPACRRVDEPDEQRLQALGLTRERLGEGTFYRAVGCPACRHTGFAGRIGVFELLHPDIEIREMISANQPARHIKLAAVRQGMRSMREDALIKARQGITSLDEVVRMTTV